MKIKEYLSKEQDQNLIIF